MDEMIVSARKIAGELLETGQATTVIGWEQGIFPYTTTPLFITRIQDVERLVWNEYCTPNLSKYLLDYKHGEGKTAIFVKGCDARGVNRLLQDRQIDRDKILLIGLSCMGMKDGKEAKGTKDGGEIPPAEKCRRCRYPNPAETDYWIGKEPAEKKVPEKKDYSRVEAIENLNPDEKYAFFSGQYEKCLRCYACRNICPACTCRECIFGSSAKGWSGKANNLSENMFFALTRALHVAGRCIDCGECQRVCPVNIPIMLLNLKFGKDIDNLFGEYDGGLDPDGKLPLGAFEFTDPEEFM
jgi:coenzyme F420-reducing hydrogenase beta subunit